MRFFALLLLGAASAAAQPALTDFIPPQSKVVLGVNLRHIIDSAQFPDLETGSQSVSMLMLTENGLTGLNPMKDVDSLLIASTGDGEAPPTVVILQGRFGNVRLGDKKNPKGEVARINDSTLIGGDPEIVHALLQRRPDAPALNAAMAARIAALADKFDVWGTGDNPKGFAAAKGQTGDFDAAAVDHFEFGASFQKGFSLDGELHVRTAKDAQKLTESFKFLEAVLSLQKTQANGSKFNLTTKDGTLKLSLAIPEEELKKAIAAQKASFSLTPRPQAKPKPVDTEVKIVKAPNGDTLMVTLPGGH